MILPRYRTETRLDDVQGQIEPMMQAASMASQSMTQPNMTSGFKKSDVVGTSFKPEGINPNITGPMPTMATKPSVSPTITQHFGNRSGVERYSGGINYGTDFAVPRGTQAKVPEGDWKVVESFGDATIGGPNNAQGGINRGYGNSVMIQNTKTGEKLRYSHLRPGGVFARVGDNLTGGMVVGETGATGNTAGRTGQHLDAEYYNPGGTISDILSTLYYKQLF